MCPNNNRKTRCPNLVCHHIHTSTVTCMHSKIRPGYTTRILGWTWVTWNWGWDRSPVLWYKQVSILNARHRNTLKGANVPLTCRTIYSSKLIKSTHLWTMVGLGTWWCSIWHSPKWKIALPCILVGKIYSCKILSGPCIKILQISTLFRNSLDLELSYISTIFFVCILFSFCQGQANPQCI